MLNLIIPPYSDEHIVSWFLRMALQHGLNVKAFNVFSNNTPYRNSQFSYDSLGTDYYGGLFREIDEYYDNGYCDMTGMDIFKATSLYTGMRALLSEPLQNNFIQGVFDPCTARKYVNHVGSLMVCPACAKEDIAAYHNPYYHRSHNMPGVVACWKHGVQLIPVAKRDVRPFIS